VDPNAALRDARKALAEWREADSKGRDTTLAAEDLAAAFDALDGWLSKAGFLPVAWQGNRVEPTSWDRDY